MEFKEEYFSKEEFLNLIEKLRNLNNVDMYHLVGSQKILHLIDDNDLPQGVKKVVINKSEGLVFDNDKIFVIPILNDLE